MTVKFANGKELPYLEAYEAPEYYDNANRRVLRLVFDPAQAALEEVNALASDTDDLMTLTLINDSQNPSAVSVYHNYGLKLGVSLEPVVIGEDAATGAEIRAERITLKLGRYTPIELQLMRLGLQV